MQIGTGVDISDQTTFAEYAALWKKAYKDNKLRPGSLATLTSNLENHVIPFFGPMKIRDIKDVHVQLFLNSIDHLSKSVQNKCLQIIRGILRTAVDNGIIGKSPVSSQTKAGGKKAEEVLPLTKEQSIALLDATKGTSAYLFCLLALTAGLRRGEILGLMWDDIDLSSSVIHVRHNKAFACDKTDAEVTDMLKTRSGKRDVPLPRQVCAYLRFEKAKSKSPYVMSTKDGRSLSRSAFQSVWKIIETRTATSKRPLGTKITGSPTGPATVTLDFHCHPHQLRHTCITRWFESGMDVKEVQYLAGHKTAAITMQIYTHYCQQSRANETALKAEKAAEYLAM